MVQKYSSGWLIPCVWAAFTLIGPGFKDSGFTLNGNYGELRKCSERAKAASIVGGPGWLDASVKLAAAYHIYAADALRAVHWAAVLVVAKVFADVLAASNAVDAVKKRVSKPS